MILTKRFPEPLSIIAILNSFHLYHVLKLLHSGSPKYWEVREELLENKREREKKPLVEVLRASWVYRLLPIRTCA